MFIYPEMHFPDLTPFYKHQECINFLPGITEGSTDLKGRKQNIWLKGQDPTQINLHNSFTSPLCHITSPPQSSHLSVDGSASCNHGSHKNNLISVLIRRKVPFPGWYGRMWHLRLCEDMIRWQFLLPKGCNWNTKLYREGKIKDCVANFYSCLSPSLWCFVAFV